MYAERKAEIWYSWLNETGSLTKRLRQLHGQAFGVKLLHQQWQNPEVNECQVLGIPVQRFQLIREVLLYANQQPLILARTVLPAKTIAIAQRNLAHLGVRPLGEVLFSYPDLERRLLQFSVVKQDNWTSTILHDLHPPIEVLGRRTVYAIEHQPLLVAEFFLPGIIQHV